MTRVDFYILQEKSTGERNRYACRLTDKAFRAGHKIYLHTGDEDSARALDSLLWNFRAHSFLPHGWAGAQNAEHIAIGWQNDPCEHNDVMINLALSVPDFVGRFARVIEVVVQEPAVLEPLRENFRFYKDRGYQVTNKRL